jgi:gamma-glutamylcyclotransferase (GGCT)/AIG2-like uncharacterized protein YtfP
MHRVFVYGTLKKGHGSHNCLETSHYLGPAITVDKYVMLTGGFPVLLDVHDHVESRPVKGEVYEIDNATLKSLDDLERYYGPGQHNSYDRLLISVQCWDGKHKLDIEVQAYIGGDCWYDSDWPIHSIANSTGQLEWPRATS